jgi:hypothetical protein
VSYQITVNVDPESDKKKVKLEKPDLYRERGHQLMDLMEKLELPLESSGATYSFITYDENNPKYKKNDPTTWNAETYIGKFEIVVDGPPEAEEKIKIKLTEFADKSEIKAIIDPSVWVKMWDWLTKTKG